MFLAALPLFVACSNAPARSAVETATPAAPAQAARLINEAKEFAYLPAQVTVKAGQPVEIVLKNTGVTTHDFTIEKIAPQMSVSGQMGGRP